MYIPARSLCVPTQVHPLTVLCALTCNGVTEARTFFCPRSDAHAWALPAWAHLSRPAD